MADKQKPIALRRVRRKADGMNETYYLDASSGKEVFDLDKYDILEAQAASLDQLGLGKKATEEAKKTEATRSLSKPRFDPQGGAIGGDYYEGINQDFAGDLEPRTASNNFGYAKSDPILDFLANTPNPIAPTQAAARLINTARNINNKYAVAQGRKVLGIEKPEKKLGEGQLGDIKIGDETYPVGYEALEPTPKAGLLKEGIAEFLGTTAGGMVAGPLGGMVGGVLGRQAVQPKEQPLGRTNLTMEEARRRQSIAQSQALPRAPDQAGPNAAQRLTGSVFKDVDVSQEVDKGETLAKGMGLGDLSPSFRSGVRYSHADVRGPVETGLTPRTVETLQSLAEATPGGLNVTSAHRNRAINAAVGGAPGSQHITGDAFDVSTRGLTDMEKRDLIERAVMSGGMEIGTYPDKSLHIGTTQRSAPQMTIDGVTYDQPTGGVTAMFERSRHNYLDSPSWFKDGLEVSRLAATPTPRPDMADATGFATAQAGAPSAGFGSFVSAPDTTPTATSAAAKASVDLSRATKYSDMEKRLAAATLAGEIDPRYTDLSTPEGIQEANAIMSTIENRVNKYGTIKDTILAPNQYSTWNTDVASQNAIKNYKANPKMYDDLVSGFFADPKSNLGYTSYYNPSLASPGWSTQLEQATNIGPHRFGFLGEYKNAFGSNVTTQPEATKPSQTTQVGSGIGARASAKATFNTAANTSASIGSPTSRGMASDENANRSTPSASRESRDRTSTSASTGFSSGRSSSEGKTTSSARAGTGVSAKASAGFSSRSTPSSSTSRSGGLGTGASASARASFGGGTSSSKSSSSQPGGRVDRDEKGWK